MNELFLGKPSAGVKDWILKNHQNLVPLTFTAETAGSTVSLVQNRTDATEYEFWTSTDGTVWTSYTLGDVIVLENVGDKVMFKGNT